MTALPALLAAFLQVSYLFAPLPEGVVLEEPHLLNYRQEVRQDRQHRTEITLGYSRLRPPRMAKAFLRAFRSGGDLLDVHARRLREEALDYTGFVLDTLDWVRDRVHYDPTSTSENPMKVFNERRGDCKGFAALARSLLERGGAEVRERSGYILEGESIQGHRWIEVLFPGAGWFLFDPSSPRLSARYLYIRIPPSVSGMNLIRKSEEEAYVQEDL